MPDKTSDQLKSLFAEAKETFKLNVDYARLTAAEKLTVLFSTCVFGFIAFVLVSLMLFFLSLMIVNLISEEVGFIGAYAIMAGVYVVLMVVLILMRRQLIINPISRAVSRLLFNGF
ncbi:MAG: phage holin family protein [Duncaniella sp.]|nr:phage holin family protein [Duncaniella sp.]